MACTDNANSHISPHISYKPLLWAHNCRADNTATVIVLQLAALHHISACLSFLALLSL